MSTTGTTSPGAGVRTGDTVGPLVKAVGQRRIDGYSGVRPRSIHTDEDWARRKGFRRPLAQGMMSTAYVSELMVGVLGRGFVEGGRMDVTFLAPVFADDVLHVGGTVTAVAEQQGTPRVEVAVEAHNHDGHLTLAGCSSGWLLPDDADPPPAPANRRRIAATARRERFRRLTFDALTVGETFRSDDRLIRPEDLETYAFAVEDHHPWFTVGDDPAAAIDSPYGEPVAHPTLLGNQALFLRHTRYVVPAGLHAKMSFAFLRPVRLGVRARSRGRLVDTYERRGRQFMVTEFETFDDRTGEALVEGRFTQMLLPERGPEG
jgi:3-hydroxybutyryl-CoA dehydratase